MNLEEGQIVLGKVVDVLDYGAFVELENGKKGLVHISEVSNSYVKDIKTILLRDQEVKVKILKIDSNGKYNLSIKQAETSYKPQNKNIPALVNKSQGFEDVLSKFLKDSEDRQRGVKKHFESKRSSKK